MHVYRAACGVRCVLSGDRTVSPTRQMAKRLIENCSNCALVQLCSVLKAFQHALIFDLIIFNNNLVIISF